MLSDVDENKSVEWKSVQRWILKLKAMGVSTIMVHHSGKEKTGYRGSSKMMDCADSAISLQFIQLDQLESEQDESHRLKIIFAKGRNISGKDKIPFEATMIREGWEFQSLENSNMSIIIEQLHLGLKQIDISRERGWSRAYVSKMVKLARRRGLLIDEK